MATTSASSTPTIQVDAADTTVAPWTYGAGCCSTSSAAWDARAAAPPVRAARRRTSGSRPTSATAARRASSSRGRVLDNPAPSEAVEGEGVGAALRRSLRPVRDRRAARRPAPGHASATPSVETATDRRRLLPGPSSRPRRPTGRGRTATVELAAEYRGLTDRHTHAAARIRVPGSGRAVRHHLRHRRHDPRDRRAAGRRDAAQTFTGSALTRTPFPGAPELYRDLAGGREPGLLRLLQPVEPLRASSSAFLRHRDFPLGPLLLRDLIGTREGRARKHERIEEVLALHPDLQFVLIGDSGEHDPEIYADIVRAHPGRFLAVYIREVRLDPGDGRVEQVSDALGPRRAVRAGRRQRRRTPARRVDRAAVTDRACCWPSTRRRCSTATTTPAPSPRSSTAAAARPGRCTGCCARSWRRSTSSRRTRCSSGSTTGPRRCARQAYPAYKAGRAEKDPALVDQLERAAALLDALGMLTVTPPGLEADDVNASAATWAERAGWNCVLITSDRDAFAHISDRTQVLRLITGGISGLAAAQPGPAARDVRRRGRALPGVRRPPRRRQRQPAGRARHRREDRAGPAVPDGLDAGGLGRHRPLRRRDPRGHARLLLRGGGPAAHGCRGAQAARHPGGPGAVRVQPVDDVGPHRPRPRPDPGRAGQPRAAAARRRTGSRGWSATSASRRRRTWRCGSSPSRRRALERQR